MTDGDMTACLSGITRDGVPFGAVHTVFDMDGDGHRDVDEETIGTSTLSPDADRVCLKNQAPEVLTTPGASFLGSGGGGAVSEVAVRRFPGALVYTLHTVVGV